MASPPSPKKRLTRLSAVARCSALTPLTSALAPVTTMPPPMPSRNSSSTMRRNPVERGSAKSATAMKPRPRISPTLSPCVSSSGPTPSEAMIRPRACDEGDGAVLRRGEVESLRKLGQDGAQHGGDHSVDKDGEDGGEDQHGARSFRIS